MRILEFRIFDLLKNKDNEEFINKVKTENPELYVKFVNILGRNGLDFAKAEYLKYSPEYLKDQRKKESLEKRKEKIKKEKEDLLLKYKLEIDEVENILDNSELFNLEIYIEKNKTLRKYLTQCSTKVKYNNLFLKLKKTPHKLIKYINGRYNRLSFDMDIDEIDYSLTFKHYEISRKRSIINIRQMYNYKDFEVKYNIDFNFNYRSKLPDMDKHKKREFLDWRSTFIGSLDKSNINITEVYNLIDKFSSLLSDEYYENWLEEWNLKQEIEMYNL